MRMCSLVQTTLTLSREEYSMPSRSDQSRKQAQRHDRLGGSEDVLDPNEKRRPWVAPGFHLNRDAALTFTATGSINPCASTIITGFGYGLRGNRIVRHQLSYVDLHAKHDRTVGYVEGTIS